MTIARYAVNTLAPAMGFPGRVPDVVATNGKNHRNKELMHKENGNAVIARDDQSANGKP